MEFTIVTYNIHKGIGNDGNYDLNRIIQILKSMNPDIIALQEVDKDVPRSNHDDEARLISDNLNMHFSLGLNVKLKKGFYGNAILSRWPILHQENMDLKWSIKKHRSCLSTVIDHPVSQFNVMNFHLGLAGIERLKQIRWILESDFLVRNNHLPSIILGDSNDRANKLDHILDRKGYRDSCRDARINTFPSYAPVWRLDKIYYNEGMQLLEHHVSRNMLTKTASDHLPVMARFRLKPS